MQKTRNGSQAFYIKYWTYPVRASSAMNQKPSSRKKIRFFYWHVLHIIWYAIWIPYWDIICVTFSAFCPFINILNTNQNIRIIKRIVSCKKMHNHFNDYPSHTRHICNQSQYEHFWWWWVLTPYRWLGNQIDWQDLFFDIHNYQMVKKT